MSPRLAVAAALATALLGTPLAVGATSPKPKPPEREATPHPSRAFEGVWVLDYTSSTAPHTGHTVIHFQGDRFTYADAYGSLYGSFSPSLVTVKAGKTLYEGMAMVTVLAQHDRPPRVPPRPLRAWVSWEMGKDGETARYCATEPGTGSGPPGVAAQKRKDVACFDAKRVARPDPRQAAQRCVAGCTERHANRAVAAEQIEADCRRRCGAAPVGPLVPVNEEAAPKSSGAASSPGAVR